MNAMDMNLGIVPMRWFSKECVTTYGCGSDHFTNVVPGINGMNWFNAEGQTHPGSKTRPDVSSRAYLSIGYAGNIAAIAPNSKAVHVSALENRGQIDTGKANSKMNRVLRDFESSMRELSARSSPSSIPNPMKTSSEPQK